MNPMGSNNKSVWILSAVFVVLALAGLLLWRGGVGPVVSFITGNPTATTTAEQPKQEETKKPVIVRENVPTADVASVVANLASGSKFAALVSSTGVNSSLSTNGLFTVFIPTDEAFGLLTKGTIENMTATEKKRLVQYHIISGKKIDSDAVETGTVQALSKDTLNFEVRESDNSAMVNSAFILKEYRAKNGVVYLISAVLVPPLPRGY